MLLIKRPHQDQKRYWCFPEDVLKTELASSIRRAFGVLSTAPFLAALKLKKMQTKNLVLKKISRTGSRLHERAAHPPYLLFQ